MVVRWTNNMRKLLNTIFYTFAIVDIIYTISIYENLTLTKILFFTVFVFMLGIVTTLDVINIIIRYIKKGVESCD